MRNGLDRCWNRIGVGGDATCPQLAALGHCRNCGEYARGGRTLLDREPPADAVAEWSRVLAEVKTSASASGDPMIAFQVCSEGFALHAAFLERVTAMPPVHTVPSRSGDVFRGVVNIDGELLPCFSAAAGLQLGGDGTAPNPARILVLHQAEARLACAVDQVTGFVRLMPEDLETPPVTLAHNQRAFTIAVFLMKGKHAGLLDGARFIQHLTKTATV